MIQYLPIPIETGSREMAILTMVARQRNGKTEYIRRDVHPDFTPLVETILTYRNLELQSRAGTTSCSFMYHHINIKLSREAFFIER